MSSTLNETHGIRDHGYWDVNLAAQSYGIADWGRDLFEVTGDGHIASLHSSGEEPVPIKISEIVEEAARRNIQLPLLVRFPEMIEARANLFRSRFADAIRSEGYEGGHRMIYPIKVNPENGVVRSFIKASEGHYTGIEVGSKAELIDAIHHLKDVPDSTIICNGKKDDEFISLALRAQQIGQNMILVSESPGEIDRILNISDQIRVDPILGLRLQVQTEDAGLENNPFYKPATPFGLSIPELLDEVDLLKSKGKIHLLRLLHFHNSTQTRDRSHLRETIAEVTRVYRSLVDEGAPMGMLDVGGGVPVVGTGHPKPETQEHPLDWLPEIIFRTVLEVLNGSGILPPEIITESGRSIVAHSTVLVFDTVARSGRPRAVENPQEPRCKSLAAMAETLARAHDSDSTRDLLKDANFNLENLNRDYSAGKITLRQKAKGERMFHEIKRCIAAGNKKLRPMLEPEIAEVQYASISIFRSLPDLWGLGEVFPTAPISGLNLKPTRLVKFRDLTCDPDGIIDNFIWDGKGCDALPLPDQADSNPIGIFLVGAYQEIIGSSHNLFGSTNVVNVSPANNKDGFEIEQSVHGSTISDMLSRVNTCPKTVLNTLKSMANQALCSGAISKSQHAATVSEFGNSLGSYTYFQPEK